MGHREIDDPPDGDVFNFTGVPSGTDLRASLGLNEQKLARAFNELDQAGPRLADLGTYLKGAQMPILELPRAVAFGDLLTMLTSELTRMIDEVSIDPQLRGPSHHSLTRIPTPPNPPYPHVPISSQELPSSNTQLASSFAIIGPLPEKPTRRFKSWGHH